MMLGRSLRVWLLLLRGSSRFFAAVLSCDGRVLDGKYSVAWRGCVGWGDGLVILISGEHGSGPPH
jgi:hypothetical protein